jgi:hypothetical protein
LFNKEELSSSGVQGRTKIIRRIDKSVFNMDKIKIKDPEVWDVINSYDENSSKTKEELLERRKMSLKNKGRSFQDYIYIPTAVRVSVHAPYFFKQIQQSNGITTEMLIHSLGPSRNRNDVFKSGAGAGASGSFFFFSSDKNFIIKTMSNEELK